MTLVLAHIWSWFSPLLLKYFMGLNEDYLPLCSCDLPPEDLICMDKTDLLSKL